MRIHFQNGSIPTRAAKRLKEQQGIKESEARRVTAVVLGYRNWADLENLLNSEPASPLDEECDAEVFRRRRQYQTQQLQDSGLELHGSPPADVIASWQPSAARPQTPVIPKAVENGFRYGDFREAILILHDNPNVPGERYSSVLLDGIRHETDPRRLTLVGVLAQHLLDGTRKRSPELARQMLEALTERGDARAIFNLTTSLMLGDGGPKDEKRAADLLESLVNDSATPEKVRAMAQSRLGSFYAKGMRRSTDARKALRLWEQAAEKGDGEAGFNAGLFHGGGRGVPEDLAKAAHFYRLAAENGYVPASTNLGLLLLNRPDLATNLDEAESRLQYSAKEGDANAVEALKAFNRHLDKVMRDFDNGRIPDEQLRGVQETFMDMMSGKPMAELFKDRAPSPKSAPNRHRASRKK